MPGALVALKQELPEEAELQVLWSYCRISLGSGWLWEGAA